MNVSDFLVVYMVDTVEVGERFTRWPLHMTILPWFTADSLNAVLEVLQPVVRQHQPFTVEVGERAFYGQIKKLPVKLIVNNEQLQALHTDVLGAVTGAGWPLQGRYTGANYSPHVTQKAGRDAEGVLTINAVHIAEALPQGYRTIVSKLDLAT